MSLDGEQIPVTQLVDSCIAQLQAQGPSRTCSESQEKEEEEALEADRETQTSNLKSLNPNPSTLDPITTP